MYCLREPDEVRERGCQIWIEADACGVGANLRRQDCELLHIEDVLHLMPDDTKLDELQEAISETLQSSIDQLKALRGDVAAASQLAVQSATAVQKTIDDFAEGGGGGGGRERAR